MNKFRFVLLINASSIAIALLWNCNVDVDVDVDADDDNDNDVLILVVKAFIAFIDNKITETNDADIIFFMFSMIAL